MNPQFIHDPNISDEEIKEVQIELVNQEEKSTGYQIRDILDRFPNHIDHPDFILEESMLEVNYQSLV